MAEAPRYRPNPAEALRMECIAMAIEAVTVTGADLIETSTAILDFIKGKRRKAEVREALASDKVIPWPKKLPDAS